MKCLKKALVIGFTFQFLFPLAVVNSQDILKEGLPSVVAIGRLDPSGWIPLGTGFLMYNYDGPLPILVTNRHVFETRDSTGAITTRPSIAVKLNIKESANLFVGGLKATNAEIPVTLVDRGLLLWTGNPNPSVDVAVTYFPGLDTIGLSIMQSLDVKANAKSSTAKFDDLKLTQEVLFFGFPLGLGTDGDIKPIVRLGMISYLDPAKVFLIDAQVFNGSSGSPVYLTGTNKIENVLSLHSYLAGVISAHLPSPIGKEVAARDSTPRHPDTTLLENSGLGVVYSTDLIYETIKRHNELLGKKYTEILKQLDHH